MDAIQFLIYITRRCSQNCPNCYYPKSDSIDEDLRSISLDKLCKWIIKFLEVNQVKYLKLQLLGGEPFLNLHTIFHIFEYITSNLPPHVLKHPDGMFGIYTNGDFLNGSVLTKLSRFKPRILLNPTDQPLYDIEEKVRLVKRILNRVSLAVPLTEMNMERLNELGELMIRYEGAMRLNRLYNGGRSHKYKELFRESMHRFLDLLLSSEYVMWPNFIVENTYITWKGEKNPNACGKWLLVIDPDGSIRSCNADMRTRIGHIDTHMRITDFVFPQRWSCKNIEICQKCEWKVYCQGGCPYTKKLAYREDYQEVSKLPSPFCDILKELFPKIKALADRWEAKHGHWDCVGET